MNMSENINDLAAALVAFQGELTNPKKTASNPHHGSKYTPLDEIMNTIRPILMKHGLMVIQSTGTEGELITCSTRVIHKSGQWLESALLKLPGSMKGRNEFSAQALGSAISYGRRYQLSALLGITSEDDDDANGAQGFDGKGQQGRQEPRSNRNSQRSQGQAQADPRSQEAPPADPPAGQAGQAGDGKPDNVRDMGKPVSTAQVGKIKATVKKVAEFTKKPIEDVEAEIRKLYKYESTTDLTAAQASRVIDTLEKWERQAKDHQAG